MTGEEKPGETETPQAPPRPSFRERWARHTPGIGLWVGVGILGVYVFAAVSALVVFRSSLGEISVNLSWIPPSNPTAPSWDHPFGIMPGLGTDLLQTIWQATPWDLGLVVAILGIDVAFGFFLGGMAGAREGGVLDGVITFVGDSIGSIPTFFFVIIVFAGLATVAPARVGLPAFAAIFGLVLWPTMARTVRDRARSIANEPYVEASRASGASPRHLLLRHILPNSLGPVLAQIPLDIAPIFFVLSAFPWYFNCAGFGPPPPPAGAPPVPYLVPQLPPFSPLPTALFPEWGFTLGVGACEGISYPGNLGFWWMWLFPVLVIVVFGIAVGLLCDGIERWMRIDR